MPRSRYLSIAALAAICLLASGCGSSSSSSTAAGSSKNPDIALKVTDAGCTPLDVTAPAGTTTFKVTGASSKVTEAEVVQGSVIQGETENVIEGLTKSFTLALKAGTYALHCNGGTGKDGVLTVTGNTTTTQAADAAGAVANYRTYIQGETNQLVTNTKTFTDAVVAGNVTAAKAAYAPARIHYEAIEPVAESFSDLDTSIDARADDTPVDQITGFHRLEYALWSANSLDGMAPIATQLYADVQTLQSRIPTLDLDVPKIANGANDLLGEVSASKVTGEEERYSHLDLYDFAANVNGSEAAVSAVRPLLDKVDPDLGKTIDTRYAQVETDLTPLKTSDGGYVLYTSLSQDQIKALSQDINALAEPVSQVAAKVAS